ncbi:MULTISPECIES: DEAD/DEAH box helicase [unclassified Arenibacter]|jgi:superfamily II DNA/RNA helicase|uniref:DEAD/DEAH box helicase n=1 Tax=unclassified Arenibacter TaxID=2615047 RepID=UPI000E341E02|nr:MULTISPECIES: DEAD/DEAH box helicase [unclassified Arenibacter]MCM4163163.1 DEAD/DEAH box helicase [Arenibacter sp. A80]RFT57189.1 DEAD/DEAH box helicase [Arenibacter sp. P308M17]
MSFKKIQEQLKKALEQQGIKELFPFQKAVVPKLKGGASIFGIAPHGAGKTTSIVIGTLQKLNCEAFEEAPRALIFVKDKEAALAMQREFERFTRRMDLRIYSVYEEHNIEAQRNEIFEGVDIVIATPKRLSKIFYLNGINLGKLKLFIVDDAEFLSKPGPFSDVIRIPESLDRCQYAIFSTKFDGRMERMQELFMANAQVIEVGE